MNGKERPQRSGAGIRKTLSQDFVWPDSFGRKEDLGQKKDTIVGNEPSRDQAETSEVIKRPKSIASMKSKSMSRESLRTSKTLSINVARRRINLETERKRQEIEMKKLEIENALRLLNLEEELVQDEDASGKEELDEEEGRHSEKKYYNNTMINQWVERKQEEIDDDTEKYINTFPQQCDPSVKMLCETVNEVLHSVNNTVLQNIRPEEREFSEFICFDGNPLDWPVFIRQFRNLTESSRYSADEIVFKLQKCLKGPAKAAVAGIMLTSDVAKIIATLETRFGRPDVIIEMLLSKIRVIQPIKDTNLEKLIHFSTEVTNIVTIMKSLHSIGHLQNPQLQRDLVSKLPDELKIKWGEVIIQKKRQNCETNLEDFANWLATFSEAACQVSVTSFSAHWDRSKFPWDKTRSSFYNGRSTERVFTLHDGRVLKCNYCEEPAHDDNCPKMEMDDMESRWKVVRSKKLCFSCLKRNHQKLRCRNKKICGKNGCKLSHHSLLHNEIKKSSENPIVSEPVSTNIVGMVRSETTVLLRFVPLKIHGRNGTLKIYALCDEGSTVTLLHDKIADQIGILGEKQPLCLQWTNDDVIKEENSTRLDINISRIDNDDTFLLRGVRTVSNLSLPEQSFNLHDHQYLEGIPIESYTKVKPVMIIGQDNIDLIIPRRIQSTPTNSIVASKSKLGWSVHGPIQSDIQNRSGYHIFHICDEREPEQDLKDIMEKFYTTESFGTIPVSKFEVNEEDTRANEIMNRTIKQVGERYEIGLLWKNDECKMPNSYATAMQRLNCTERKCLKDKYLADEYCAKFEDHVRKNYLRKLSVEEIKNCGPRTWYLPHFAVINRNKKKVRVVFDAAAKSNGISLNDMLLTGPHQMNSLGAILLKFRQKKIAFCGDVREMFHRVLIREEDRYSQRILWRNLENYREPDVYHVNVMTFGAKCSPACAQFVKNYNAKNYSEGEIQKAILEKFYVDDYLDSADDEKEALDGVKNTMQIAGFEVVSWISNSVSLMSLVTERTQNVREDSEEKSEHRV
ncbi:uncharacterized protein LOC123322778 [Coccinella septempunctata]|uniref:uncharacterized protein LOC123322778 n=1 Tax=Coccinella septempunctata TaxID=41139 RepID=UPI001D06E105|nr:uncharacterized protein LOC123322778 [Coccinella septempunctata]